MKNCGNRETRRFARLWPHVFVAALGIAVGYVVASHATSTNMPHEVASPAVPDAFQKGPEPYGSIWVESAGRGSAAIGWSLSNMPGVVSYGYELVDLSGKDTPFVMQSFGGKTTARLEVNGLKDGRNYSLNLKGNGPAGVLWTNVVAWTQPRDFVSFLFPNIPLQKYSGTNPCVLMTKFLVVDHIEGWDRFYVSSNPEAAGGWRMRGLRLEIQVGEEVYPLCGYGQNSDGDSLDVTTQARLPGGQSRVLIRLCYDGKGMIGLSDQIYLLQWKPGIMVHFGEPYDE